MTQKNALSVQSLACYGKCSLTEALPIVSAAGIALSVLPTVLLSTHTGGFGTPVKLNTNEFLKDSLEHYKAQNIKFDGVYTGYFGDKLQIELLTNEIEKITNDNALILVDPVLGDKGKFFSGINEAYVKKMLLLCRKADVILPNITESYFLCGENYKENPTEDELLSLAIKLYNLTNAKVVITGIEKKNKIGVLIFDGANADFAYSAKITSHFHGTGDIFASVVFAGLLNDETLEKAVVRAEKFIGNAISQTKGLEKNGIYFENSLKNLI